MFQISFDFGGIEEFDACLQDPELHARAQASRSVLIQFLTSSRLLRSAAALYEPIVQRFPKAVVTGVTTAGEIAKGEFLRNRIVVIFSFFDTSKLQLFSLGCLRGEEEESGRRLAALLQEEAQEPEVRGILLYATTQRMDGAGLLRGMRGLLPEVPVFGAGAASYEYGTESSPVLAGGQLYRDGAAAVVFRGEELKIQARDYLGWEPLSRDMTVTETGGPTWIKTLDGVPAAEVYEKYLGIRNDEHFFKNMLEFPLMIKRADQILARVPVAKRPQPCHRILNPIRGACRCKSGKKRLPGIRTGSLFDKKYDFIGRPRA
ncbi:FIST signal transduction protein [Saccharibacillus deserti]|uniref:FIST signal transduction protein n=1 Tax=Saccharibacillus deserti TaxID=1634444 RepID=UPI001552D15F|nr:FIST N-terminal domain-containing protein [Saccharibacillus deserti]